jgi:hypothetical protein
MCVCVCNYTLRVTQQLRRLFIPLMLTFTRAAREPTHNDNCGPFPEKAGHPWCKVNVDRPEAKKLTYINVLLYTSCLQKATFKSRCKHQIWMDIEKGTNIQKKLSVL